MGDRRNEGLELGNLAGLHYEQGRMQEARALYEEALAIARAVGDRSGEGVVLGDLAGLHHDQGRLEDARALHEQALAIHREVGNRRFEGIVLGNLAHWELLASGDTARAAELASEGQALLREVGDKHELGKFLGNRGHIQLASGSTATDILAEVEAIANELHVRPEGGLGKALAKLGRAHAASDAGMPLVCGYVRQDLTEGQLRWLAEHRPEALSG